MSAAVAAEAGWSTSTPWYPLPGAVTVVTGAAGGIGRRIVERVLEVGGLALAVDRDARALAALEGELGHPALTTHEADVSDATSLAAVGERIGLLGAPLALWVSNAGIVVRGPVEDFDHEQWDRVLAVNARSVLLGAQVAFRVFRAQGGAGAIVNLSSVAAHRALDGRALYGTSKAAVEQLTRQLAAEWGEHGIRVNTVAPGFVLTPISHLHTASEEERAEAVGAIPLARLGETDDIARAVLGLGADLSGYVTGQTLVVDGGLTLR